MLNGDFVPSRLEEQEEAVRQYFLYKKRKHPDNTIGLMTMTGSLGIKQQPSADAASKADAVQPRVPAPMVLASLTGDQGKILRALHTLRPHASLPPPPPSMTGTSGRLARPMESMLPYENVLESLRIGQLALKHRQNPSQAQRLVLFISAGLAGLDDASNEEKWRSELQGVARSLKKNNVALDVVHFTHVAASPSHVFLDELVTAVNNVDNSSIVHLLPEVGSLADRLLMLPLFGHGSQPDGIGAPGFDFGVDPDLDPELALALKMSLEEEQARQQQQQGSSGANAVETGPSQADDQPMVDQDLDPDLAAAIALSLQPDDGDGDDDGMVPEDRKPSDAKQL